MKLSIWQNNLVTLLCGVTVSPTLCVSFNLHRPFAKHPGGTSTIPTIAERNSFVMGY